MAPVRLDFAGPLALITLDARWNVVNRVLPDEGFGEAARAFAMTLADGPTARPRRTGRRRRSSAPSWPVVPMRPMR
jgi:hypothetical protein